ncbi:MAG: chloramphenicol acetyltransferase [Bacteroidales bacterium]|jgi:chloramphenicol O-acetyltransferase type A|nr:chloramphenicol acetyltransferase [Bacteroidales bacterium]
MKTVDLNTWKRKEHFEFFSQFDEPFFGIVSEIDCTKAYKFAKQNNHSFFALYLHKSIVAVNQIQEFKYRTKENEVIIYDKINASTTIARDDGTFGFGFVLYNEDLVTFNNSLSEEINKVKDSNGLRLGENAIRTDVVHFSAVPWFKFTGVTHARNFKFPDCVPKIAFGKASTIGNKMIMPIAINAHHGLMDALHVAKYLELLQELLNER